MISGGRRSLAGTAASVLALAVVWSAGTWPAAAQEPASLDEIESMLRTGRYEDAISRLQVRTSAGEAAAPRALRLLVEALIATGRYEEAAAAFEGVDPADAGLGVLRGRVALLDGDREGAREAFESARLAGRGEALVASFELARLARDQGAIEQATTGFYAMIDAYNRGAADTAEELVAVAEACQWLGRDDPELFKDALRAYDEAVALDPSWPLPRIRLGELFLEKYDSSQARTSIADVLRTNPRHPEALLAMARTMRFDGDPRAAETLDAALEVNPNLIAARVFRARLRLASERFGEAREEAEKAIQADPESLTARTVLAAVEFIEGREEEFASVRDGILADNPRYADLFNELADASVENRLYPQARDFAAEAVRLDSKSWRGYGLLGQNQLRLGEIEVGKANLERAFAGDPYNVWIKNTLDLVDTFVQYRTIQSEHFEFHIHESEAELLAPYVVELAEEAWAVLVERYRFEPPTPVRVELYPSHADFSVRTVGLAGLGALGVCFGPVLALDSPSARQVGHFNWGATLWHELAHTFTLLVTDAKIPRWLTEGLSVFEERRARPGWGDDVQIPFITSLRDGELLGIAELNDGFMRPKFPNQIGLSYYQASLICDWIEENYGFDAILLMLAGYREGKSTEEVFQEAMSLSLESFDERFFGHLRERFGTAMAALYDLPGAVGRDDAEDEESGEDGPSRGPRRNLFAGSGPDLEALERVAKERPDDFRVQMTYGNALFAEERYAEAEAPLLRGRDLFPEFVGPGNAYTLLAAIYRELERDEEAIEALESLLRHNETAWDEHLALADLLAGAGRSEEEADILERTLYISPFDAGVHRRLAEFASADRRFDVAVRERAALIALDPPDRAEALYRLALAQRDAGRAEQARRTVLRALEVAPGYDPAQELLLDLVGKEPARKGRQAGVEGP
ncbi:MAG: tetratricopeptide repeat protein [Acidobacteriota bacterium]|nr:tetratricopeptide repeat protein [Acidobacteriota bacterium]